MKKERACANSPAMSRRTLLTALPATGAALSIPAAALAHSELASPPDPIIPLYHEWLDTRREWLSLVDLPGNENFEHPLALAADAREQAAFRQMVDKLLELKACRVHLTDLPTFSLDDIPKRAVIV